MAKKKREILRENEQLRSQLDEAEQALRAIRGGEVDALVLPGPHGEEVYTLKTADHAYRVLVEEMQEGACRYQRRWSGGLREPAIRPDAQNAAGTGYRLVVH